MLQGIHDAAANRMIAWIGILAAEHALPLFEDVVQAARKKQWDGLDLLPYRSIRMAEGVLLEYIAAEDAYAYACGSHYDVEVMAADLPLRAHLANRAANLALTAASASSNEYRPFEDLRTLALEDNRIVGIEDVQLQAYVPGESFTDAMWAMSGRCDASAAAAAAWSCISDIYVADSVRLLNFWIWWFEHALPEAWQRATASPR
jgi:hypothetical protein